MIKGGSWAGRSSTCAARKEDVSQALGRAADAPPGRDEGREGPGWFGVSDHLQEGGQHRSQVVRVALGIGEGSGGGLGERQIFHCVGVLGGAAGSSLVAALRAVLALILVAGGVGSEAEVDLHVDRQHHLAGTVTLSGVHPLIEVSGRVGGGMRGSGRGVEIGSAGQYLREGGLGEAVVEEGDEEAVIDHVLILCWSPGPLEAGVGRLSTASAMQSQQRHDVGLRESRDPRFQSGQHSRPASSAIGQGGLSGASIRRSGCTPSCRKGDSTVSDGGASVLDAPAECSLLAQRPEISTGEPPEDLVVGVGCASGEGVGIGDHLNEAFQAAVVGLGSVDGAVAAPHAVVEGSTQELPDLHIEARG